MNFMVNACQAMKDADQAQANHYQAQLVVNMYEHDNELIIEFRDNGKGMDEAICNSIFEPFFTTKSEGQGVGLGLAISYGIIERHGERIDVNAEPDKGSMFSIYLPPTEAT
ncbi:MAG: hypothetical protein COA42_12025 [Alteromonadaceae bacterium]|nr:MAG: hypothetical protein COA42_12025 [Alteromonadaceae bacterium]